MTANLRFSTKSIFLIIALIMIPTGIVFAANVQGTIENDIIYGTDKKDKIKGNEGNDIIFGEGNDGGGNKPETIDGGTGNDELVGDVDVLGLCGNISSLIISPALLDCGGNAGPDKLNGGNGDDVVVADDGNDELIGGQGAGEDVLHGGAGDDSLVGGNGDDELNGGSGNDILLGGNGNDVLLGGLGDDDLTGGHGVDFIDGGLGNDICRVSSEDIVVNCETIIQEDDPTPPTPPPQPTDWDVSGLIFAVEETAEASPPGDNIPVLANKDKNQLLTSLNNSQVAADNADLPTACSKIEQFDDRVNRLINREKIDPTDAGLMLLDSNAIQVENCGA